MTKHQELWQKSLEIIKANVTEDQFDDWFSQLVFESYSTDTCQLVLQTPSESHRQYIEKNFISVLAKALVPVFGKNIKLGYRILVDKQNNQSVVEELDQEMVLARRQGQAKPQPLPDLNPQLDPHMNFRNFIEGAPNRLSRSVGLKIAESTKSTLFNPMFIFGPSGCGKTHLINAIGLRKKELYPNKRVLYVSAIVFRQQYTTAVQHNTINDFIAFYQTIDVLIVDDIQEWIGQEKTQDTFFHIFDYLTRHQKRIVLASDRSPSQLKGMHERLISRFSCGVTTEVERPDLQLCVSILKAKISRDGLTIADDVVQYIAANANGSVRDLQGVINSLMVYSIVDNTEIDVRLAEKVVKRVVKHNDSTVSIDRIVDAVCEAFKVTPQDINGKSRKKEITLARQVSMYLTQKLTSMQASRIGRLIGGRDHSTVLHSCSKIDKQLKTDTELVNIIENIKKALKE